MKSAFHCACWLLLSELCLSPTGVLPAQQPAPLPTLQAQARAVLVDVVVTDGRGHPVHGLTRHDFHIVEDGAEQTILSFEEVRPPEPAATAGTAAALPLPRNTFTNARQQPWTGARTVILLDSLDTPLTAQSYPREQLLKYLETMKPSGPVAIFQLGTQLHLIQGFTTDPAELLQAVKDRAKVMETVLSLTPETVQFRYDDLTRAFASLGTYLAAFPGRKNLIWFTGSAPSYSYQDGFGLGGSLRDAETFSFDYTASTALLTLGRVSIYPIYAEGARTDPAFSAEHSGPVGTGASTRFAIEEAIRHQDLRAVATSTGGRAFFNNGMRQAIEEVIETGANYYTLSFSPRNTSWNGEYRRLHVMVDRADTQLEYRHGYYARQDTGLQKPSGRRQITNHGPAAKESVQAFSQSMELGGVDPGGVIFEARVSAPEASGPASAVAGGQAELLARYRNKPVRDYTVLYTLDGKQLQLTPASGGRHTGGVAFALLALDDKGIVVNSALTTVNMDLLPATYRTLLAAGVQIRLHIAVPVKGDYFLRAGVRDMADGNSGALEVPVGEVKLGVAP